MTAIVDMKLKMVSVLLIFLPLHIFADKASECQYVACPKPEACPLDSTLKLIKHHPVVHNPHHQRSITGEIVRHERAIAYDGQQRESIKIIPGAYDHHNRKRSLSDSEQLIQYCCSRYECACKTNYCDQVCPPNKILVNITGPTDHNNLQYGVPGNCCPPCKDNYCMGSKFHLHGEKWREHDCSVCECHYGEVKCEQTLCKTPDCVKYKNVPGECCPVCDNDATSFCPDVRTCNIHCKYGYQQRGNCDLCKCMTGLHDQPNASSYPGSNITGIEIGKDNINDSDLADPHQRHTFTGGSSYLKILWVIALFLVFVLAMFFVGCCCFRKSAKYSTVQTA